MSTEGASQPPPPAPPAAPAPPAPPAVPGRPAPTPAPKAGRGRALGILLIIVVVVGLAWFAFWKLVASKRETTDDAYVNGDIIQITSQVPGTVVSISKDDTASVQTGDELVQLDATDAQVAVQAAEADLAGQVRAVRQLVAATQRAKADVDADQALVDKAASDLGRRSGLSAPGVVSDEDVDHARMTVAQAKATLASAQAALVAAAAEVDGTTIAEHPLVLAAAARLRQALLNLDRCKLVAPASGMIAKRTVQLGQSIQSGQGLLAVVPSESLWIDANFKERQLREVRTGQRVLVTVDIYGGSVVFHGQVVGVGAGTGSAFAVLPAQNASGNWIKIVQRLPVRIGLDPHELAEHPLRIGLSAKVEVRILDGVESPIAGLTGRGSSMNTTAIPGLTPAIEQRIAALIATNLGDAAAPQPAGR